MIEADVSMTKACKMEQLILKFTKIKLSISNVNRKVQNKISKLVMKAELKDKQNSKQKLKEIIKRLTFHLKTKVNLI